jgi:Asp-tRNA(Asn)/Glu-tRNA(Gln) amidotransferase C subunit
MSETQTNGATDVAAELASLAASAGDALTDDMVARLAGNIGEALALADRINRSPIADAVAVISQLVDNGDLERLAHVARLLGAAEDALTDEMVARLAGVLSDALSLLEQLTRNDALGRILAFLLQPEVQTVLIRFGEALLAASNDYRQLPPAKGGISGWWRLLGERNNQQAMQFFGLFGKHLQGGGTS